MNHQLNAVFSIMAFLMINVKAKSQISNISNNRKHLYVYNLDGKMISEFFCNGNLFGYSTSIIGSADAKHVYVYDETGRRISDFFVSGYPIHVNGDYLISKDNKHVYVYSKNGRKVSDYFER
jgi:hypothetical protein